MSFEDAYEKQLSYQTSRRKAAVELIQIVGDLWYEKSIELVFLRNQIVDRNVSEILRLHEYAADFVGKRISIFDTVEIAKAILALDICPARIDIGKLTYEYHVEGEDHKNATALVAEKLKNATNKNNVPKDVVLYGFGRIGRLLARELITLTGNGIQLRLRAIVVRGAIDQQILEKRASLLQQDSIHGIFPGTVKADAENETLIINGIPVKVISANSPDEIDYTQYGINDALVIDNSGAFRDEEPLGLHLKAKGTSKVLLTAPGKEVPNIVHGVNHLEYDPKTVNIFSAASCTTNAITPILKVIEDVYGVKHGHLETIHAYTNDQNLVDNMHKKYRRGRAAAINMVITETGAGQAVSKAIPSLEGKLTSNAIRVPVPNGSLAILNLELNKKTDLESLNNLMKDRALEGDLVEQIQYSLSNELVSNDIIGTSAPAIYDSKATIVNNGGHNVILYIWYDNEYGYSHQVIRLAIYIAQVRRYTYY